MDWLNVGSESVGLFSQSPIIRTSSSPLPYTWCFPRKRGELAADVESFLPKNRMHLHKERTTIMTLCI